MFAEQQHIDITETLDAPLTWHDMVADAARYGWRVAVLVVVAAIVVVTAMAALHPDTQSPEIPMSIAVTMAALWCYRFGQFVLNP